MSNTPITAVQVASVAKLGDKARALLKEEQSPREYLSALIEAKHFRDAVTFLAFCLPRREAVWWAWSCARKAAGAEPPPEIKASLEATEQWIAQPTDENRRRAMAAAEAADIGSPAGAAGAAAFYSGGSLAPPEVQPVPPGPYMTAQAVSASVTLSAYEGEPEMTPGNFQSYLEQGLNVATRIKLW